MPLPGAWRKGNSFAAAPWRAVALDLDHDGEVLGAALAAGLSDWADAVAEHFEFADARRRRSFAGLVLTAKEGAYIRRRAERSSRPFSEAGAWLAELAERESWE